MVVLELAAVSLIADEAKKAKDRLRDALQAEMDAIGADRVKAEYGDDVIAYVTTSKPKFKWVIKSDKRFLDWVRANIPSGWDRVLTMGEVDEILAKDLARFESGVQRLCPSGLTPGRFGALVSFAFNVGLGNLQNSTLRMKHNRGEFEGAAEEFLKWNKAGGKELKGLTTRRKDERALYLSQNLSVLE